MNQIRSPRPPAAPAVEALIPEAWRQMLALLATRITVSARDLVEQVDVRQVVDFSKVESKARRLLVPVYAKAFTIGARWAAGYIPEAAASSGFDKATYRRTLSSERRVKQQLAELATADEAVLYRATRRVDLLVDGMDRQMQQALRESIRLAVTGKITLDQAAKLMRRSGLGASGRDFATVSRQIARDEKRLMAAHPKWSPTTVRREAERRAMKRLDDLAQSRVKTLMRTELMRTMNFGKEFAWAHAQDQGELPDTARKMWQSGGKPCPQCAPLVGTIVSLRGAFEGTTRRPPLHPNCMCELVLVV